MISAGFALGNHIHVLHSFFRSFFRYLLDRYRSLSQINTDHYARSIPIITPGRYRSFVSLKKRELVYFYCVDVCVMRLFLDRRQSKTLILPTNVDQKQLETEFLIAICRRSGDSKTLFLAIFDPRSSIVKSGFECRKSGVAPWCLVSLCFFAGNFSF